MVSGTNSSRAHSSKAHLGIADNSVAPGRRGERKSVGVERTFRDKTDDEEIMATLEDIAIELGKDLEKLHYAGKTVTVKYKVSSGGFRRYRRSLTISCILTRVGFEICDISSADARQNSRSFGQEIHLYARRDTAGEFGSTSALSIVAYVDRARAATTGASPPHTAARHSVVNAEGFDGPGQGYPDSESALPVAC